MPPRLSDYYQAILRHVDQQHHNYALTPECEKMSKMTEAQKGELETNTAYAEHAGGDRNTSDLYVNGVHVERLIK